MMKFNITRRYEYLHYLHDRDCRILLVGVCIRYNIAVSIVMAVAIPAICNLYTRCPTIDERTPN